MATRDHTDELPFVSAELVPVEMGGSTRALGTQPDPAPVAPAAADAANAADASPTIGSYQVLERLGQGALGESLRCHDPELRREVVVKVLRAELAADAAMRERFVQGARAMARADAPELATVFHVGEHRGRPYLAVEHLDGPDLGRRLQAGPLELREALRVVGLAASAVDRLQQRGLAHGNLKPGNLFADATGVRLTDAGLGETGAEATSPFRAPGQASTDASAAQADVYALGAILFACVTGAPPATTRPAEEQLEGLPPPLAALLRQLLASDPAARFASPAAAARALAGLTAALAPAPSAPPGPAPATGGRARRPWPRPRLLAVGIAAVVAALALGALFLRGPDWEARLAAGEAAQVRREIEAVLPARRTPEAELYLGHACDALEAYDQAFAAYARAAARGAVDARARAFVLGELDVRQADDVVQVLARWPDDSVDAPLVQLVEEGGRWQRQHALAALEARGKLGLVDLQQLGLRELAKGRSCDERKRGVRRLIDAGRTPAALAAVQQARRRALENLCMQRELEQAERAIQQRLQAH